jgi:hypothetical protein
MKRADAAIALRDHALKLVQARGVSNLIGAVLIHEYVNCGLTIQHIPAGTPYQRSGLDFTTKDGIDVWAGTEQVLNVKWEKTGKLHVVSFKRGPWLKASLMASRSSISWGPV